jgi:hypothetical protein
MTTKEKIAVIDKRIGELYIELGGCHEHNFNFSASQIERGIKDLEKLRDKLTSSNE